MLRSLVLAILLAAGLPVMAAEPTSKPTPPKPITHTGPVVIRDVNKPGQPITAIIFAGGTFAGPGVSGLTNPDEEINASPVLDYSYCPLYAQEIEQLGELKNVKTLIMKRTKVVMGGMSFFKQFPNLEELSLAETEVTDDDLVVLQVAGKLKRLDLTQCDKITGKGLEWVGKLEKLEVLDLSRCPGLVGGDLKHLKGLSALRELTVSGIEDGGDALKTLKTLKNLKVLRFEFGGLMDDDLTDIGQLQGLEVLDLGYNRIKGSGLKHLKNLKTLRELSLSSMWSVGEEGLEGLDELQGLKVLNLDGCHAINDAGFKHVKALKGLEQVDLRGLKITDAAFKDIKDLKNLKALNLRGSAITDAALKDLKELKALKTLDLSMIKGLTDAGMKDLGEMKSLEGLDLSETKITSAGLRDLRGLVALKGLGLKFSKVTDDGLEFIKELKSLKAVDLSDTPTTTEGRDALRKAMPGTIVISNWTSPETGEYR
jgi:internalin A